MLHNPQPVAGDNHYAFAFLNELEMQINQSTSPEDIVERLNDFLYIVNKAVKDAKSKEMKSRLHILQQEAGIKAFNKLATLRKGATEFNAYEMEQLSKLPFINMESGKRHFFEYDADHIDRTVSRQFDSGTRWLHYLEMQYHAHMIFILLGWAKSGLLHNSKNPALREIGENMKVWESSQEAGLFNDIMKAAIDMKNILDFVTEYLMSEGWAPLFQVVTSERIQGGKPVNIKLAMLSVACKEHGMNLRIYSKNDAGELRLCDQINDELIAIDVSADKPTFNVLYDEKENKLVILDEIKTASHLYRRLAVRISRDVLDADPLNTCALEVAGNKGLAYLPEFASKMANQDVVAKADAEKVVTALSLFIKNHKGACDDDKVKAQRAIEDLKYKTRDGFFSMKNAAKLATVAATATAATVVGLEILKRNK